jgi:hypothetical protein
MRLFRPVAAISCVLVMAACGSSVPPTLAGSPSLSPSAGPSVSPSPAGPVRVILGIYSGRPDPEWTLSPEQAATVNQLLAAMPGSTGTPPEGGLGYHGFTILFPGTTLIAYRGVVAPPGTGPRAVRLDPTRSLERYLLETARAHVRSAEYAEAKRALDAP